MDHLITHERPSLHQPPMILGFTGWMDGGRISTGTVEYLAQATGARKFAEIDSAEFYIHHFPATSLPLTVVSEGDQTVVRPLDPMEYAAIFRPHGKIVDGVVRGLTFPRNDFLGSEQSNLILFHGEEPHIRWRTYAECLLGLAEEYGTEAIFFIGSVSSPIPHTREPRVRSSVADEALTKTRRHHDVGFSDYEGPASFITFLLTLAAARGIEMRTLVVEVPHYPFLDIPAYPASILRVTSVLAEWLGLDLQLSDLRRATNGLREQLDRLMEENEEFGKVVRRLEESYDAEEVSTDEESLRRLIDKIDLGGDAQET